MHLPSTPPVLFLSILSSPLAASAFNIVMSNEAGWAEQNIRTFYDTLTDDNNKALISAPAVDKKGSGSNQATSQVVKNGCEYSSCPKGSTAIGKNASEPHFNYVNSYPVTAMKYGVETLSDSILGGQADIVVTGPNTGVNLGIGVPFSGDCGAASAAADQLSVPGIAFSGASGQRTAWNSAKTPAYSLIYAELAANLTNTILNSGAPYLPNGTWLNVNFAEVGGKNKCDATKDFKFVLTRIWGAVPFVSPADYEMCGNKGRLPSERQVIMSKKGCYASVSVGRAQDKFDQGKEVQAVVAKKLSGILECFKA